MYRKILTSAVFQSEKLLKVWIWCLVRANWHDAVCFFEGKEIRLETGQFLTGRFSGSEECSMNPSTFYKCIKKLEEIGNISVKSSNKMSLISIVKYDVYQGEMASEWQQEDNRVTTKEQQSNTDKEVKNRSIEKERIVPSPVTAVLERWNTEAEKLHLTKILKLSDKRLKAITARLAEKEFDLDLCFKRIEESAFVRGENDRGWKVDFDWLFGSSNNYLKLLEGKYSGTGRKANSQIARATFRHTDAERRASELTATLTEMQRGRDKRP